MQINIDGKTKLYGVIGDPIAHSLSPVFQNQLLNIKNINAVYIPLRIAVDGLKPSMELIRNNFAGFNVTIPHKESIMEYLDEIDDAAKEYGAVNTVKICDGKLVGYNTDGVGFLKSLEGSDADISGKEVLLLGAGGAAKVIAFEIVKLGGKLTIANRNIARAEGIQTAIEKSHRAAIKIANIQDLVPSFQVIINSTPIGMYPNINECPVEADILKNAEFVYDVIYNPLETELLRLGKQFGAKTINGLPMLIYQGMKSFQIWTGQSVTSEEIADIHKKLMDLQRQRG